MGAYAGITLSAGTIVFGDAAAGIEPGATGYITSPSTNIVTNVIANKIYALGAKSDASWTAGGDSIALSGTTTMPPAGAGQFTLIVDDETAGSPGQPKFTTQGVTTSTVAITGHLTDARVTTTAGASEGNTATPLYMAVSLASTGIKEVTYGGTITFTVTN